MQIKGNVHCLFEQSGTFKNEFIKLGYNAYDYDIQNNFLQTDYVIDLFSEIDTAYNNITEQNRTEQNRTEQRATIFDSMSSDDLIVAFYPCIYFCEKSQQAFLLSCINYRALNEAQKIEKIMERENKRHEYYLRLERFIYICLVKGLRIIFENPYTQPHYLHNNFLKKPSIIDNNRMLRGDYFRKPTAYWFFNCEPTAGESFQNDKEQRIIERTKSSGKAGLCSEDRSMISSDYARNWICDFVIGKKQSHLLQSELEF